MSREHIGPMERHPGHPETIEQHARELSHLAEQALRVEATTDRTFEAATAHWEGLRAYELLTAPLPVKRRVAAGSEALAWAAAALHYWADRVRSFNQVVADLELRWHLPPRSLNPNASLPTGGPFPAVLPIDPQEQLATHREELRQEWRSAYQTYIEEGEQQVAAMLREGPTLTHLRLLREAGQAPDTGAWSFFQARWDIQVAPELALELITRMAEPDYLPTLEETEQLAALLQQHADDPRFAHFLSELTPQQLFQLIANLAGRSLDVVQVSGSGPADAWETALRQVQEGLGVALATATFPRGTYDDDGVYHPGTYELDPAWIDALIDAGESTYFISGYWPSRAPEVYGYQLLGPLLRHGTYHHSFLVQLGGAIVDFEMAHGGSKVWTTAISLYGNTELGGGPYGGTAHLLRLDWSSDWDDPYAPAGFDPLHGLMSALERNPEGARLLFTAIVEDDRVMETRVDRHGQEYQAYTGEGREYLPRLDYLLTERTWFADVNDPYLYPSGWADDWGQLNPGHAALGRVLEVAVTDDPSDSRAVLITEQLVVELLDTLRPDGNIVPAAMRESMAKIVATYVTELNQNVFATVPGSTGPWALDDSYVYDHEAELRAANRTHLRMLLEDLGRDEAAQEVVRMAQLDYVWQQYEHHLTRPLEHESDLDRRLSDMINETRTTAEVLCALDRGLIEDTRLTMEEKVERLATRRAHEALLIDLVGMIPHPAARAGALAAAIVTAGDTSVEDLQAQHDVDLEKIIESLQDKTRALAEQMFQEAIVQFAPIDLPPELLDPATGELIPTPEWGRTEQQAWKKFLESDAGAEVRDAITEAGEKFSIYA